MSELVFCVGKEAEQATIFPGYSWGTGTFEETGDLRVCALAAVNVSGYKHVRLDLRYLSNKAETPSSVATIYWVGKDETVIESKDIYSFLVDEFVPANDDIYYFGAEFHFTTDQMHWTDVEYTRLFEVKPHYTSLKKQYKKEDSQMFFREKLEGKLTLYGIDYEKIVAFSAEDTLQFHIHRNDNIIASAVFNKTDCKFNMFRKSVELALTPNDAYTKVLDKYKNTYDLIKLAPAMSSITLTKRSIIQVYVQGEKVISSYAGGTYWEDEVDPVDSADALQNHFYFAKGPKYFEISLDTEVPLIFSDGYDRVKATFCGGIGQEEINTVMHLVSDPSKTVQCKLKFRKLYDAGTWVDTVALARGIYKMSDGTSEAYNRDLYNPSRFQLLYDTYQIEIWAATYGYTLDQYSNRIFASSSYYGNDNNFMLSSNNNLYYMLADEASHNLYLSSFIIEYQIWARLLCSSDIAPSGTPTYDVPYDDFAVQRANYKKCIGLTGYDDNNNSVFYITQKNADSKSPTKYGMNEEGVYFTPPHALGSSYSYLPLARSSWGNTSLWMVLCTDTYPELNLYEKWCSKSYVNYTIKDCFHIGNVIKSLLSKIDSSIKHEPTAEYSRFLYGNQGATASSLFQCQLYITQKTNILKGDYDEAAKKAEITLENVMSMLRNCFRCYWYIDDQNRFIIEHVSYFINGHSYSEPVIGIDLTKETDAFNKKNVQYDQQQISYNKQDLQSRFEFGWMDDSTDAMGNLTVDILDQYVKKDNKESITVDKFSSDIDFMLFKPDAFAKDGFALIAAKDNEVLISEGFVIEDKELYSRSVVTPQNWVVSWNNLIQHYALDMPGRNVELNNIPDSTYSVSKTKRFVEHNIQYQFPFFSYFDESGYLYKSVKTDVGIGYIDSMSTDVDTGVSAIVLTYSLS